jgi:hypothetical protein
VSGTCARGRPAPAPMTRSITSERTSSSVRVPRVAVCRTCRPGVIGEAWARAL